MNDFLSKPIDVDQLARVLAKWIRRARQARAMKGAVPASTPPEAL